MAYDELVLNWIFVSSQVWRLQLLHRLRSECSSACLVSLWSGRKTTAALCP